MRGMSGAYPETGSTSWDSNSWYIGKYNSQYNFLLSQAMTSYETYNYVNRNLDYLYRFIDKTRIHLGGFYSAMEGQSYPNRSMWRYSSDIFSEGEYLDTILSYNRTGGASTYSFDRLPELTLLSKKLAH